ncbi:hypothetical protein [Limimonas halophila]|nr:hypothetical protein [Limimonas halophila]
MPMKSRDFGVLGHLRHQAENLSVLRGDNNISVAEIRKRDLQL